ASTFCEIKEAINKRHEKEIRYCKLTDIKAKYSTIELPHISSQFFSTVNNDKKKSLIPEDLHIDTINDNFIENIVDELQTTLKTILSTKTVFNIALETKSDN
ncbi:4174_t:CDS:2, partial [Racocetra persica]